jgi:hypothetical protein
MVILAGFKLKEGVWLPCPKNLSQTATDAIKKIDDYEAEAPCTRMQSICLRAACKRLRMIGVTRLKSS